MYGYVIKRIKELCETAGVQLYIVPYTSRACPECGYQDKMNRVGARFTRELIVPLPAKPRPVEYFSMG